MSFEQAAPRPGLDWVLVGRARGEAHQRVGYHYAQSSPPVVPDDWVEWSIKRRDPVSGAWLPVESGRKP